MNTMVTPIRKLSVSEWPKSAADMMPVKMVAIVDEYFLRMVSAYLKKNEDRMPCSALFTTSSIVTCTRTRQRVSQLKMSPDESICGAESKCQILQHSCRVFNLPEHMLHLISNHASMKRAS